MEYFILLIILYLILSSKGEECSHVWEIKQVQIYEKNNSEDQYVCKKCGKEKKVYVQ